MSVDSLSGPPDSAAPSTGAASACTPWVIDDGPATGPGQPSDVGMSWLSISATLIETSDGARSYLKAELATAAQKQDFVDWLWAKFPASVSNPAFTTTLPLTSCTINDRSTSAPILVHPAMLAVCSEASLRPDPDQSVSKELLGEFAVDGFMSNGEPLLLKAEPACKSEDLTAPWADPLVDPALVIPPMSLGYVKAKGRSYTLLALLHMAYKDGHIDPCNDHPKIFQTTCEIFAQPIRFGSLREEAIFGMKVDIRSSIRKPPNVIKWVMILRKLQESGDVDASAVVKEFNKQSSAGNKLVGLKANAVKQLLDDMPAMPLDKIVRYVSVVGWEASPFTDDMLSSKRILPNVQFRCQFRSWMGRLRTTPESCALMVDRVIADHMKAPLFMKTKVTRSHLEKLAEVAAFVSNVALEASSETPLEHAAVVKLVTEPWVQGQYVVDTQVSMALADRADRFKCTDLAIISDAVSVAARDRPIMQTAFQSMNLEKDC